MTFITRIIKLHLAALLLLAPAAMSAQRPEVKQGLDSTVMLMGHTARLKVTATVDASQLHSGRLMVADKQYPPEVEVRPDETVEPDTQRLADGRVAISRDYIVQPFDSGLYTLPPALWVAGGDTSRSANMPALKVLTPAQADSMQTVHDYSGALDGGSRWYDPLPDWLIDYGIWICLGIVVVCVGVWWWLQGRFRLAEEGKLKGPQISPYDAAMHALEHLRSEHLCEHGQEKEFYTRLTDILRTYLHDAFAIDAMEMTSTQILDALEHNPGTHLSRQQMQQVLQMADFVKFARMRPLPDDNKATFEAARNFVELTKPLPEVPGPCVNDAEPHHDEQHRGNSDDPSAAESKTPKTRRP